MKHLKQTIAAAATLALAVPAIGIASDDGDIYPGDPDAITTVIGADGTVTNGNERPSSKSFVAKLVAQKAQGGVLRLDTRGYQLKSEIRTGYAKPTTALAPLQGRSREARGKVTVVTTVEADGTRTIERGHAVEIATGRIQKVSIAAARDFSANPAEGKAGLAYHYSIESGITGGS